MAAIFVVLLTIVVMILSLIFFPKIKLFNLKVDTYWVVVLIGATLLILTTLVDFKLVLTGLFSKSAMNPLKLVILFIMMTFFSLLLDQLGFFRWIAMFILSRNARRQVTLFLALYGLVSILTIFTSNDVIILTFTPLVIYFSNNAKINPLPYLFAILTAANTWSIMFIVGNPTNMYLALNANVNFSDYFKIMFLPAITAGLTGLLVLFLIFNKELKKPFDPVITKEPLKDKFLVLVTISFMMITLILLAVANYLQFELYLIVLSMALLLTIIVALYLYRRNQKFDVLINAYKLAPWSFIPLVLGMFVLVEALKQNNALTMIASELSLGSPIYTYGLTSFLVSNLMNNQPMSMLFSEVLKIADPALMLKAMYASVVGSNLGVLFTPLGALAGLMWMNILHYGNVNLTFKNYIKNTFLIGLSTIPMTLGVLYMTLL